MKRTCALVLIVLFSTILFAQTYLIQQGFPTTSMPAGWSGDVYFNSTANIGNLTGANGAGFNLSLKYLQTPAVNSPGTLTFWMKGSAAASAISLRVLMQVNGGAWSTIGDYPKPHNTTATLRTIVINNSSSNIVIKFEAYDRTGNSIYLDDVQLTQYITATPTIITSPSTLSGFTYEYLTGPSSDLPFTVSGVNLTNGVSIAAPTNYEISKTSGSGYTTPLTYTIAEVATPQTVYVRLKENLAIGAYNGEVINITSIGATGQTVTCSGSVTSPPPPDVPEVTEPTVIGTDSFTATWDAVTGATGYYLDVYTLEGSFATDLIISEYVEGSGYYKAIEIYNGTGAIVDLSNYILKKQTNGAGVFASDLALSGNLAHGDVYVIVSNAGTPNLSAESYVDLATGSQAVNFNGNDAVALYKNDGRAEVQIDVVGIVDQVTPNWGADVTFVRKSTINSPSTSFSMDDWDSYALNTFSYLGSHTMSGFSLVYVSGYQNLDVDNVTSYEVTGLEPNTTYYYVVRSYNDYGTSSSSLPQNITTQDENVPVVLSSFTAVITAQNYVMINWTTQTETNVSGYYIYRNTANDLEHSFQIPALIAATNTSQETQYSFIDQEVEPGNTYYYWLQNMDMGGSSDFHGPISVILPPGEGPITPIIPTVTELLDAYPNPFGQSSGTRIHYTLKNAENVKLEVYNIRGQIVWTANYNHDKAGDYRIRWDGKDMSGKTVSTGVYYYRMTAGKYTSSKKVILMK